jgi:hypothetical protein
MTEEMRVGAGGAGRAGLTLRRPRASRADATCRVASFPGPIDARRPKRERQRERGGEVCA